MTTLSELKVAYYGDDFTGATDTLATAACAGLRSMLFLRPPPPAQLARAGELDCIGIAGAARSMTREEMRAELAPVAEFFGRLRAPVLHYKICSTFDSSPEIGNIAIAIEALRRHASNPLVAIVGGQPNLGRYCLFGNLFAAAGAGGAVYRIDRHPTMSMHPVTPMHEGDLRVHLARQGLGTVRSMDYLDYAGAIDALEAKVDAQLTHGACAVLFDVACPQDLAAIGRVLWQRAQRERLLAVGASSVLQALAAHWSEMRATTQAPPSMRQAGAANGPVFVLAGSLSPITAGQVAAAHSYERVQVDARRLAANDRDYISGIANHAAKLLDSGSNVLAVTAEPPRDQAVLDAAHSAHRGSFARADISGRAAAIASGELVAQVLSQAPVRRLGIAGGDTSSHAVIALGAWGLSYASQLAEGVALCRLHGDDTALDGLEVMLKGGQMGPVAILEHLVHGVPRIDPGSPSGPTPR